MSETPCLILVVDDDAVNRDLLTRRLERKCYTTAAAGGGPEALAYLTAHSPDMVLLDWQMPGMSGLDVLHEIRKGECSSRLPVLMVTARTQTEDIVTALEGG
ncbi:MAG: response regulator, partial [Acidobacteriota bacterium]